jgi:tetratricopeptide (TPR) repeat protein
MAEYHAFGLKAFFYNLDNLILHVANALLVVLLVSCLTEDAGIGFWAGVLFVIHPVQWEAVCNVPGRSILLSAFFELAGFLLFVIAYKEHRPFYLPAVLVAFFLALLCKESAGILPFVVGGYLCLQKDRPWGQKIVMLWPLAAGLAAYMALRQVFGITMLHQANEPWGLLMGFLTFLRSVITDLRLLVLPVDLHYDRSLAFILSLQEPRAWLTCLFWGTALAALAFFRRKVSPFALFLIAWFWLELLPVSQLVTSIGVGQGYISTAEHFLYLACIPVFIGIVMGFSRLYELNARKGLVRPAVLAFAAGGFLVFWFLTAVEQSVYASNEYNMIRRSLDFQPHNPRIQAEMGLLSVFRNDPADAEKYFRAAAKLEPFNPEYHMALGTALCQQGQWIEGLKQLIVLEPVERDKKLVEREEKLTMKHINDLLAHGQNFDARGWLAIGIYYAKQGQNKPAIAAFVKSAGLDPTLPDAWFNLGSLYEAGHQWPEARAAYKKLLGLPVLSFFQQDFASRHLRSI